MNLTSTFNQPMNYRSGHIPVMEDEVIEELKIKPGGIYVDCTFGRGGHAKKILSKLSADGRLMLIDKDLEAIEYARDIFKDDKRVIIEHSTFANLAFLTEKYGIHTRIDGILVDLGVSSNQLDDAHRGFSFIQNGPLDMRMNQSQKESAKEWINSATENEIAHVIKTNGEHPKARWIAKAICEQRKIKPFESTSELSELIVNKFNNPKKKNHPATLIFQAIRMRINHELEDLDLFLTQIIEALKSGGRFVALSFHSLEDMRIKHFIYSASNPNAWQDKFDFFTVQKKPLMKKIVKKMANQEQIEQNSRSRSVIMRVAEKI